MFDHTYIRNYMYGLTHSSLVEKYVLCSFNLLSVCAPTAVPDFRTFESVHSRLYFHCFIRISLVKQGPAVCRLNRLFVGSLYWN